MALVGYHLSAPDATSMTLCLLGGPFLMTNGRRVEIPEGSQRLLVFVTLHGGKVSRRYAAGVLWPCGHDERAAGNLRSALWRLRGAGIGVLHADKCTLYLDQELKVDILQIAGWAKSVIDGTADGAELGAANFNPEAVDLLPGWYDEWVIFEREKLRQRMLHAMESLVPRLIADRRFANAVEVAMSAVSVEPLRESAQRTLIEAHLAEGNFIEARRVYAAYKRLTIEELGVRPSDELAEIVRDSESADAPIRRNGSVRSSGQQLPRASASRHVFRGE